MSSDQPEKGQHVSTTGVSAAVLGAFLPVDLIKIAENFIGALLPEHHEEETAHPAPVFVGARRRRFAIYPITEINEPISVVLEPISPPKHNPAK